MNLSTRLKDTTATCDQLTFPSSPYAYVERLCFPSSRKALQKPELSL